MMRSESGPNGSSRMGVKAANGTASHHGNQTDRNDATSEPEGRVVFLMRNDHTTL